MRTKTIWGAAVLGLASVSIGYYFMQYSSLTGAEETVALAIDATVEPLQKKTVLRDPSLGKQTPAVQQVALLNKKLADMEARLRSMEAVNGQQANNRGVSRQAQADTDKGNNEAVGNKLSEAEFGRWMDESLGSGRVDANATRLVLDQAQLNLANAPDVNLDDMQCGEGFCRATFMPESGKEFSIAEVAGASPFMGEGYVINGTDGSVKVYFAQAGQSLEELRTEAQGAVNTE